MKSLVLVIITISAYAIAAPKTPLHIDIYKNTLQLSDLRVVGGVEAERYQFPYQASLEWGMLGIYSYICGCFPITEEWVVTAGHCKTSILGSYRVVLGILERGEKHEEVQVHDVKRIVVHPNYMGGVGPNDIALIQLKSKIEVTKAVGLASLPKDEHCNSKEDAILSGWGAKRNIIPIPVKHLQYAKLPRVEHEVCKNALEGLVGETPLDHSMLCTGSQEGTKQSACSGDSGGPLATTSDKESNTVIGIVSWGIAPCGTKGAPSVYTSMCYHRDFINSIIKG